MITKVVTLIRSWERVINAAFLGAAVGALLTALFLHFDPFLATTSVLPDTSTGTQSAIITDISSPVLEPSEPIRLIIPQIDLDIAFAESLGLNEDGEVEVPKNYEDIGWYRYSPTPGELGPAVVLGHVDSYLGPATFFDLKELNIGDQIMIDREDGIRVIFSVTELDKLSRFDFPTDKIYGDIDHAGLRLITCTGIYDRTSQRYSHNLVVYAKLVQTEEITPDK